MFCMFLYSYFGELLFMTKSLYSSGYFIGDLGIFFLKEAF